MYKNTGWYRKIRRRVCFLVCVE